MGDGDSQEVGHLRMVRWVVAESRVLADIGQKDRPLFEQHSQNPVRARQIPDLRSPLLADTRSHEAREATTSIRDAESRVASAHQAACGLKDPLEHQVEVRIVTECKELQYVGCHGVGADSTSRHCCAAPRARHRRCGTVSHVYPFTAAVAVPVSASRLPLQAQAASPRKLRPYRSSSVRSVPAWSTGAVISTC